MKLRDGEELQQCLKVLSGQDDGAEQRDGKGFNKLDTYTGNAYANKAQALWDESEIAMIYRMLRKYKKQLAVYGINYEELPYWGFSKEKF